MTCRISMGSSVRANCVEVACDIVKRHAGIELASARLDGDLPKGGDADEAACLGISEPACNSRIIFRQASPQETQDDMRIDQ